MNCPRCGIDNVKGRATCCICFAPLQSSHSSGMARGGQPLAQQSETSSARGYSPTVGTVPSISSPTFDIPPQPTTPMTYPPSFGAADREVGDPLSFDQLAPVPAQVRQAIPDTKPIAAPHFSNPARVQSGILPPEGHQYEDKASDQKPSGFVEQVQPSKEAPVGSPSGDSQPRSPAPTVPTAFSPEDFQQPLASHRPVSSELNEQPDPLEDTITSQPNLNAAVTPHYPKSAPQKISNNISHKPLPKPHVSKDFVFAPKVSLPSLFRRLVAGGIDLVLVSLSALLITFLFGPKMIHSFPTGLHGIDLLATVLQRYTSQFGFFFVVFASSIFLYTTLMHAFRGQTLGKMLIGLQVIDRNGRTFSILGAFARSLAFLIFFFLGLVGLTWILFDKEYRALHDRLAGSLVIRVPPSS